MLVWISHARQGRQTAGVPEIDLSIGSAIIGAGGLPRPTGGPTVYPDVVSGRCATGRSIQMTGGAIDDYTMALWASEAYRCSPSLSQVSNTAERRVARLLVISRRSWGIADPNMPQAGKRFAKTPN